MQPDFWNAFWSVIDDAAKGYDATSITTRVAALGGAVHPTFEAIAESCAQRHPGAGAALARPVPGRTDLEVLGACNENSLGKTLYNMVVDQGYDLEVLDREAIRLDALPRSLRYLNTRILQMHDVWHLCCRLRDNGLPRDRHFRFPTGAVRATTIRRCFWPA